MNIASRMIDSLNKKLEAIKKHREKQQGDPLRVKRRNFN